MKGLPKAAQIRPASPEVHCNLATVYGKRNRPGDAQRERQRFAELHAEMEKQQGSPASGAARRGTLTRSPSSSSSSPPHPYLSAGPLSQARAWRSLLGFDPLKAKNNMYR